MHKFHQYEHINKLKILDGHWNWVEKDLYGDNKYKIEDDENASWTGIYWKDLFRKQPDM